MAQPTNLTSFYKPLIHQAAFHNSQAPYRLHVGGYGSGKTLNLLMEAIITCLMVPGCNCLILRTTSPNIKKTVVNKFLNPKIVPRWIYKSYNKNDNVAYFDNGSELHFGYCQRDSDVHQFLSTEYVFIGLEEAGEFSYRIWEHLTGRARLSTKVTDIYGNAVKASLGLTTNPYGNGWGWIKQLFGCRNDSMQGQGSPIKGMGKYNPRDYFYVHSTIKDNPYLYTPENVEKLEGMTGTLRAQALFGDVDTIGGQMYPQFNTGQHEGIHVMEASELRFKSYEPVWCGSDWDSANWPVIWFTRASAPDERDTDGNVISWRPVVVAFRELIIRSPVANVGINAPYAADQIAKASKYKCGHPSCEQEKFCKMGHPVKRVIEPVKRFFFSWERFVSKDFNHTIAEQLGTGMAKYGLPKPQQHARSRIDGWALISKMFDMDELVITTDCPFLIDALPQLIRDTPDDPYDVKKIEGEVDDIADAFRYGIQSYLNPGKIPQAYKDAQTLDQIKDPVMRQIRSYEMWLKKKEPGKVYKDKRVMAWEKR